MVGRAPGGTSPEIPCPEFIRFVPETILMDGVSATRLEVKVPSGTTGAHLNIYNSPFTFSGKKGCVIPEQMLPLRDDGQGGDVAANDGIFTLSDIRWDTDNTCWSGQPQIPGPNYGRSPVWDGFTTAQPGAFGLTLEGSFGSFPSLTVDPLAFLLSVIDPAKVLAPDPIYQIAPDAQIASNVINLAVPPGSFDPNNDLTPIARRLYELLPDDFDFFHIIEPSFGANKTNCVYVPEDWCVSGTTTGPNSPLSVLGYHRTVRTAAQGIAENPVPDYSPLYGSQGRLQGVSVGDKTDFSNWFIFFHETMHQWGAHLPQSLGIITDDGHWLGNTSAAGLLGGCYWGDNGDGTFTLLDSPYQRERIGNLELYMMGLIPASEVEPLYVAQHGTPICLNNAELIAGPVRKVTIQDVIDAVGPRIPGPADSQKAFHTLYVVVSEGRLFTPWEMTSYNRMSQYHSEVLEDTDGKLFGLSTLTGGLATLTTSSHVLGDEPRLTVSAGGYRFTATQGAANPRPQSLAIGNAGGGALPWTVRTADPWLGLAWRDAQAGPAREITGSQGPGEQTATPLMISIDPSTLSPGTYTSTLEITAGGQTQEIPVELAVLPAPPLPKGARIDAVVNAASYEKDGGYQGCQWRADCALARGAWATIYGVNFATTTEVATTDPLPTKLAGLQISMVDPTVTEKVVWVPAQMLYVSPTSASFLIPEFADGPRRQMRVSACPDGKPCSVVDAWVAPVGPGLFSMPQNGSGPAAATYLLVHADGQREEGYTFERDGSGQFVNTPIDLGAPGDEVYLSVYGTGFHHNQRAEATIGGVPVPVVAAVAHPTDAGLDQAVLGPVPRSLAGRGDVGVELTLDFNHTANTVTVSFR